MEIDQLKRFLKKMPKQEGVIYKGVVVFSGVVIKKKIVEVTIRIKDNSCFEVDEKNEEELITSVSYDNTSNTIFNFYDFKKEKVKKEMGIKKEKTISALNWIDFKEEE